jgi:alpha-tubulin suppressor-like RCC1 family protein
VPVAVVAPAPGGTPLEFTTISAGAGFTCAVAKSGAAYCWGFNGGQLGDGTLTPAGIPVPVAVAPPAGSTDALSFVSVSAGIDAQDIAHACGITKGGAAYCWGKNSYGRLGDGSLTPDILPRPTPVAPPSGADVALSFTSISAGLYHTCALAKDGSGYCWGKNDFGQLASGAPSTPKALPSPVTAPPGAGSALQLVSIGAGAEDSCGIAKGGAAYCWGEDAFSGTFGRLGVGSANVVTFAPLPVAAPAAASEPLTFASLSVGASHTCGVEKGGTGYCWGFNTGGQLGTGNTTPSTAPIAVAAPSGESSPLTFTSISAAWFYTCGTAKSGGAWCWGVNAASQLGNGDTPNGSLLATSVAEPATP